VALSFVTNPDGKPINSPERPIASGWLKVGDGWYYVDLWDKYLAHEYLWSNPLRKAQRPLEDIAHDSG
jgi:hypothetical protein